ncbi:MAG: hypothetical protein PHH84_03540 [Oscillospiraceae bacterium]|nr:hypothetical protein [Oscillospiraceae bacterium]MDD4413950.1 hypothetical protein [Oscillospiraceae bacterium]
MTELLEAMMVISFGVSWPISIITSYKSKTSKGKSLFFLLMIAFGYACGIAWKCIEFSRTGALKYPAYFYFLNFVMVMIDVYFYFRNKRFDNKRDEQHSK